MADKYVHKAYKHQEWPKMYYHPHDAGYVICEGPNDVPQGFVDSPEKCKTRPAGELQPATNFLEVHREEKANVKKSRVGKPTLESLELTRKDALRVLREEKIPVKGNASNSDLAKMISDLLGETEDGDSE